MSALIDAAVAAVVSEVGLSPRLRAYLQQAQSRRAALGDVLIANDTPVSPSTCQAVEALLLAERTPPVELAVMLTDCPSHVVAGTRLVVWQGMDQSEESNGGDCCVPFFIEIWRGRVGGGAGRGYCNATRGRHCERC
jgi:hypothetical protein